jgi:hypothetical protein
MTTGLRNGWIAALSVVALSGLTGCSGGGTDMTAEDQAALKAHDAGKMKIPPGAMMTKPANFHSSIEDHPSGADIGAAGGKPPIGGPSGEPGK